jgi:hypothetical protein
MKTQFTFSLLAAAVCGLANAQTAYTTPVGYTTQTLAQGFNNVGLTLHAPAKVSGDLDTITTNSVQDASVGINFSTTLGATGVLHVLEITSGTATGLVAEINSWTASTITTVDNLSAAGVVAGDRYRIRKCPTLEEIFTTNTVGGTLTPGTAATADIVHIPTGTPGSYTQYFLNTAGTFRKVSPAGAAPNVPIVYLDGIFVQRRASGTKDLVISGELKPEKISGSLVTGYNYLGTVFPSGSTIQNSGLENSLTAGTASTADIILVPSATVGQYTQVFRSTANTWRTVSPAAVASTIELKGAIFIQRKGSARSYSINAPSTYSNL